MTAKTILFSESILLSPNGTPNSEMLHVLNQLVDEDVPFLILSNCSFRTTEETVSLYRNLGFVNADKKYFYSSLQVAIDWIKRDYPERLSAGYLGGKGMRDVLRQNGFSVDMNFADWVFIGTANYLPTQDYAYILRLLCNGAELVVTDMYRTNQGKNGMEVGGGAVAKMFEYASGKKAMCTSFPSRFAFHQAIRYLNSSEKNCLMICSDIEELRCCKKMSIQTALLSSYLDENDNVLFEDIHPDYFIENLLSLIH